MRDSNIPSVVVKAIEFNNKTKIEFNDDDIVLLVGANNVGKSRTLKDLREDLVNYGGAKTLINNVCYDAVGFNEKQITSYFEKNILKNSQGDYNVMINENHQYCFSKHNFSNVSKEEKNFYKVLFSYLSTENRLTITRPIRFNFSVDNSSFNILRKLELDTETIKKLNGILALSFEKSIDVYEDYEEGVVVKGYKIGECHIIADIINSNTRDSKNSLKELEDLYDQGDGIRSAIAILSSLIVNEHSLFLIDEPETFLHPPQSRQMGKNIVELSQNKQCFIATHNIDFIKGIVEANSSRVKIIKIDRIGNENTFNLVNNTSIAEVANDKNLKYTNILDGLFYNRLVLCENESDCKFYAAILEKLDLSKYQSTLFCAVGGKDQFKKVIPLLKELSIQFMVIADIDLIDNKKNVEQILNSVEAGSYEPIRTKHGNFLEKFEEDTNTQVKTQADIKAEINKVFNSDKYMSPDSAEKIKAIIKDISCLKLLKKGGRGILPQGDCVSLFDDLNNYLKEHGIFILECGEIERFVSGVGGHGNDWLEKVFERYSDINDPVYDEAKKFIKNAFEIE